MRLGVCASSILATATGLASALAGVGGCTSSGTVSVPSTGDGGDDSGSSFQPAAASCTGPSCISGTATIDGFGATWMDPQHPGSWSVSLFGTYPVGGAKPIGKPQLVAGDASTEGTWAFNGLDAGTHYYVRAAVVFGSAANDAGSALAVTAVVGPLAVGASGVPVVIRPLQATVLQSALVGQPMQLDWVLAHLFDPNSGAPITDASVSVLLGDASLPVPTASEDAGVGPGYLLQFAQPPAAQPTYLITAAAAAFDADITAALVASVDSIDAAPPVVDAGSGGLTVSWQPDPQADYATVDIFASVGDGGWASTPAFTSPQPDPPEQTSESVPALDAGTYLVNVSYTRANCLSDAGCVQAATVAAAIANVN